jgi:uncharacterized membrane protein YdjX (TVP38/TMEM64 family)
MNKIFKRILMLIIVIGLIALYWLTPLREWLTPTSIETFVSQFGVWAPVVYGVVYFLLTISFVSAAVFSVLAGTLFGPLVGSIVVIISATLAAATGFIIARYFASGFGKKMSKKPALHKFMSKIETQCERNSFQTFFIMRCLFVPYMPLSYAAGLVKCAKLRHFVLATFVTNMIFTPAFVYLGDNLFSGPKALLLPIVIVIMALSVPKIITTFQKKSK